MRFLLVLASLLLGAVSGDDKIVKLPGAPAVNFNQYAGYITVDQTNGRNLFYWFVESQSATAATDPLVLWLNGGPGCSSLGGLLGENGPFIVNKDGATLRTNPSAWNKIANVIYLESPAGVGFSYSNTQSDYTVGDARTASDSVTFMHLFLQKYPQYANNSFWVTGESYGGHYVPNLALAIVNANAAGQQPFINIAGFQVGNAWTDATMDNKGAVQMWWSHALISDETYNGLMSTCDFSNIGPLSQVDPAACDNWQSQSSNDMQLINIYDIYADVCLSQASPDGQRLMSMLKQSKVKTAFDAFKVGDQYPDPDPCLDDHMTTYLNTPSVQAAIHSNISYAWADCSGILDYSRTDLLTSMIPVYHKLLSTNLKMLVFSGDVDGIVPVTGTRAWLGSTAANLTISSPWRSWTDAQGQTGGYTQTYTYNGGKTVLTFASVRDAGHMVPYTQPGRSFDLFSRFLTGQPL